MQIKASEMERLFNLSPNGFKLYEKYGIIHPERDENSGYRRYSETEGHLVVRAQQLRGFGFSMKETADIINSASIEEQASKLVSVSREVDCEIARLQKLSAFALHQASKMRYFAQIHKRFMRCRRPGLFWTPVQEEAQFNESGIQRNNAIVKKYIPYAMKGRILPVAFWEEGCPSFRVLTSGVFLEAEEAEYMRAENEEFIQFYPPKSCILTGIRTNVAEPESFYAELSCTLRFLRKQGIKVQEDALAETIGGGKKDGIEYQYEYLYIPVDERDLVHLSLPEVVKFE